MNKKDLLKLRTAIKKAESISLGDMQRCVVGIGLKIKGLPVYGCFCDGQELNNPEFPKVYDNESNIIRFSKTYKIPQDVAYSIYWKKFPRSYENDKQTALNLVNRLIDEGYSFIQNYQSRD